MEKIAAIVSTIVCKFDFVPSGELSEDGSLDGRIVVEAAHRTQTHPKRLDQPLLRIVGTRPFPPITR